MDKPKILIIDDDVALCESLRDVLELEGYLTKTAHTAEDGIKKVDSVFFNIVLLDMKLPDMEGIKVLEKIKDVSPDTEVIIFTAFAETQNVIDSMEKNAFSYFPKPFETPKLLETIKKAYEKQHMLFENRKLFQQVSDAKKDWENTFDSISDLISINDNDFNIIRCNKELERLLGCRVKDLIGKKCYQIFHDKDEPIHECPFIVCKKSLKPESREMEIQKFGGTYLFSCFPRFDEDGKLNGIVHIVRDISERKKAEVQIQQGIDKLKTTLNGIINTLALTVEQRDPYTAGHQQRVSKLARAIAEEMGLPKDQIEGIRMAGVIHDIGKMHIPSEILSRPGRLTVDEFNIVKSHAQVGYDILKGIEFPWPVADIVHQHHEKIDGSGYPMGLTDGDILMEARILCVADVVEAIASHRPYRPALGMDKALEEISKNKDICYDSDIVDACLKVIKEKGFEFDL